jgi:hypothetical protein
MKSVSIFRVQYDSLVQSLWITSQNHSESQPGFLTPIEKKYCCRCQEQMTFPGDTARPKNQLLIDLAILRPVRRIIFNLRRAAVSGRGWVTGIGSDEAQV